MSRGRSDRIRVSNINLQSIYARYRQALFTVALARTGHRQQAEDAVHDVFARLCRLGLPKTGDRVAYVFAAVRNAALDQVRRLRTTGKNGQVLESIYDFAQEPADQRLISAERDQMIATAVDALPADQRETLVLRVYADLSFAQISEIVGAPLPTVASRYQRALERLRQPLEKLV